jgi:hypothetical protein
MINDGPQSKKHVHVSVRKAQHAAQAAHTSSVLALAYVCSPAKGAAGRVL